MNIDLSQLSASDLDELIAEAVQRRAEIGHPATDITKASAIDAIHELHWHMDYQGGRTLFCLWFPGIGWRGFIFSPEERATLTAAFIKHTEHALAKGEANSVTVGAASAIAVDRDKERH